jgi:hypothetical protein
MEPHTIEDELFSYRFVNVVNRDGFIINCKDKKNRLNFTSTCYYY